jgi:hypothetical protein
VRPRVAVVCAALKSGEECAIVSGRMPPVGNRQDPRRVHGRREQQVNEFTREMKACLLGAAEDAGNRMVAISNARLPTKPNKLFTQELIEFLRQSPKGMQSYF